MQAIMEPIFDILYLITVTTIGFFMIAKSKQNKEYLLFGIMAVVLGLGDAFHLIPRIIALTTENGFVEHAAALGIGKFITSISMTGFYVILYYIWRIRYNIKGKHYITVIYLAMAVMRIICCFFPQNNWLNNADCTIMWTLLRNVPFLIMGIIIISLFAHTSISKKDKPYNFMFVTIILSFGFYIPVLFWADSYPMIGMLMIPKTCAYVWTIAIGFADMLKSQKNNIQTKSLAI